MTDSSDHSRGHSASKCLFVGDLSFFCTEDNLRELFSAFGDVIMAEIKRGKFGDSLMHGFVELATSDAARESLQTLNDTKFMGRKLRFVLLR